MKCKKRSKIPVPRYPPKVIHGSHVNETFSFNPADKNAIKIK
jgi:hypothetical protein